MSERGFFFFKKKVVQSEGLSTPDPEKAAQFVAGAKATAAAPKAVEMVAGRAVYSTTPVMTNQEAEQFQRTKPVQKEVGGYVQASPELFAKKGISLEEQAIRDRFTRAGYHDLDEQVETAPSFSDSQGQAEKKGAEPSEMTPEEMLATRETLLQEIGGLKARQMALDDALDAASIQRLSQVNKELGGKEALLKDLEEALANGADSKQPGQ